MCAEASTGGAGAPRRIADLDAEWRRRRLAARRRQSGRALHGSEGGDDADRHGTRSRGRRGASVNRSAGDAGGIRRRGDFGSRRRPLHRELAMSRIAIQWRSLRMQVREHRAQLRLSLRVTIAALLSLVLSHLLNVPLPLWAVLTAVILTQVSFGRSLNATIAYWGGTLGGSIYAGAFGAVLRAARGIALACVRTVA